MRETISSRSAAAATADAATNKLIADEGDAISRQPASTANDSSAEGSATTTAGASSGIKRPLTLELNPSKSALVKRQRFNASVQPVAVLNSPDLQLLKATSPELEKFMTSNSLPTPTPSLVYPPSKVTSAQEDYAKGFVDALNSLHNNGDSVHQQKPLAAAAEAATLIGAANVLAKISGALPGASGYAAGDASAASAAAIALASGGGASNPSATTAILGAGSMSGGSVTTYTNLDSAAASTATSTASGPTFNASGISIKDEPVASPPPHSPIDMCNQERIKLERKRQRNRVAASKCRKRKLQRIENLEIAVKNMKAENSDLSMSLKQLKENVALLKQEVIEHIQNGCQIDYLPGGGGEALAANSDADIK